MLDQVGLHASKRLHNDSISTSTLLEELSMMFPQPRREPPQVKGDHRLQHVIGMDQPFVIGDRRIIHQADPKVRGKA